MIILAGGLGTRLKSVVADIPKPMAPVNEKPFLHFILDALSISDVGKIVLSVGYKHKVIQDYLGDEYKGVPILYAVENEPLGTGGGIKLALQQCSSEQVLILNGDTYFTVDHERMLQQHVASGALLTLALKDMKDPHRYGAVEIHAGLVRAFKEKDPSLDQALINGGVYFANRSLLELFPSQAKSSFESDILEKYVGIKTFSAFISKGLFIDIGIPEDYFKAQWIFKSEEELAEYTLFLDRDGVINTPKPDDYVKTPQEFVLTANAIEALGMLKNTFKYIFIVTNQQGIERELMTDKDLEDVHLKLYKSLKNNDLKYFDGVFYAPYLRTKHHHWRKPDTGMVSKAMQYCPDIDQNKMILLGDSPGDMELAGKVDALKVRVTNPQFNFDDQDLCFSSLFEFAQFITQN